jgi:hypothetical protein
MTDLCYPEWTLTVGGEIVCTFSGEFEPEHQVVHLELPATHELLVLAPKRLTV